MDVFGNAVLDYQQGNYSEDIITRSSLDEEDKIPLPYLFRSYKSMPILEQKALQLCEGKILDIGSGAGSHSLYLQENGLNVTALDNSKGAIETCKLRGVQQVIQSDIVNYSNEQFETLLLLMNGIGLAGALSNLNPFLLHLKSLLSSNGQIILDSSDIIFMFDTDEDGGIWIPGSTEYYGEVTFTMHYKKNKSTPFKWLYLDFNTLKDAALTAGLKCQLILEGEHYDYLARLTHI